ncbi:fasciclin domain-containing protein [Aquirufa salirivi]|uniref:Fasciclin domain-containing protein n=1 Tax=Aquirufa salirivi TaxID=3104729 RepID=A0ABW8RXC6_9BACT
MTLKRFALTLVTVASIVFSVNAQKTIVDIAVGSKDHSTLVAALKAADLVSTLQSAGPFTVFAPTNAAFAKLPAGTVDNLLKAENKATLAKILTYHVIAGNFTAASVLKAISDAKGKLSLKTVSGANLLASLKDGKVILTDEKGGISTIVATDLAAGNGVIHVIDTVVLPN